MIALDKYLYSKFTIGSTKRYLFAIEKLSDYLGENNAINARFIDITSYLHSLRQRGFKNEYVQTEFYGIKQYYKWLVLINIRVDDPTDNIKLNDLSNKCVQFQDLFTTEELTLLLKKKNRYELLKWRDYLAISFYIYQGLTTGEISSLTIHDISLEKEVVFIMDSRNCSRILKLNSNQTMAYKRYITFDRPFLLKFKTDQLFIGKLGQPETSEGFHYLIESQRKLFPTRKLNPKTVRQSVIVNLLKQGVSLMEVQLFAGHHHSSTTERYIQQDLSQMRSEIDRFFPLK
ncbi:MAG: tyrosine-type recombinase/integrase [Bacteroidetes bacterium]|nr:tyrosine-type recombinase/integrase [Bacteroidota bacterium]